MFTIKHQGIHGDESLFQARHVVAVQDKKSNHYENVECFDERYEPIFILGNKLITHGTIYVMNDSGKTVAVYTLAQE